jgi:hypothetical protein
MNGKYRLNLSDLYLVLEDWDRRLKSQIFLAACGGTALTLYGHKESTKDVDFLVPDPRHYNLLVKTITKLGYKPATGNGFKHPYQPWIFDLFRGQTVFQTSLLDPIQEEGKHRIIKKYKRITLACLNPDDLIISKMFRGDQVDVQDSIVMIKAESIDLGKLAQRYKETAGYYYDSPKCKKNLTYLIEDLEKENINATPLKKMSKEWTP